MVFETKFNSSQFHETPSMNKIMKSEANIKKSEKIIGGELFIRKNKGKHLRNIGNRETIIRY